MKVTNNKFYIGTEELIFIT